MRVPSRFASPLIALCVAAACARTAPTTPAVALDLRSARTTWERIGPRSYQFTSSISCFCDPATSAPARVTVQNGVVSGVVDAATGAARPVTSRQPIDSVFAMLERAAAQKQSPLLIEFDPTYGFPTSATVGSLAADAGYVISISAFRPLP